MTNKQLIAIYALQVFPVTEDDGGGFEGLFPQLACSVVGYGETQQEAVADLLSAVPALLKVMEQSNRALPDPEGPGK